MVKSCVGLETSASNLWMTLMQFTKGVSPQQITRNAKLSVRATLDEIENTEHELNEEQERLVLRVKAMRLPGATADVSRLKPLLLQCRKVRMKLQTLAKKRLALENHMDTLDNSELNQHVLHSMQKTSHALKGMGLEKTLESVDRVMMDLEENHGDINSIQSALATTFDNAEDFDWEAEMAMLLQPDVYLGEQKTRTEDRQPTHVTGPVTLNAFHTEDEPVAEAQEVVEAREAPEVRQKPVSERRVSEESADAHPVLVLSECIEPYI